MINRNVIPNQQSLKCGIKQNGLLIVYPVPFMKHLACGDAPQVCWHRKHVAHLSAVYFQKFFWIHRGFRASWPYQLGFSGTKLRLTTLKMLIGQKKSLTKRKTRNVTVFKIFLSFDKALKFQCDEKKILVLIFKHLNQTCYKIKLIQVRLLVF